MVAGLPNAMSRANTEPLCTRFMHFKATITHVQGVSTSMLSTLATNRTPTVHHAITSQYTGGPIVCISKHQIPDQPPCMTLKSSLTRLFDTFSTVARWLFCERQRTVSPCKIITVTITVRILSVAYKNTSNTRLITNIVQKNVLIHIHIAIKTP